MKISELLLEAEEQGKKAPAASPAIKKSPSNLPSINDEPEDDSDIESDEDQDEDELEKDDALIKGIEEFKKYASDMGKGLYSITPPTGAHNKMINILKGIGKNFPESIGVNWFKDSLMDKKNGELSSFAIILNSRTGDIYHFSAGEMTSGLHGNNWQEADNDQLIVLNKLQKAAKRYEAAVDSGRSSSSAFDSIQSILNSHSQPPHAEPWELAGISQQSYNQRKRWKEKREKNEPPEWAERRRQRLNKILGISD